MQRGLLLNSASLAVMSLMAFPAFAQSVPTPGSPSGSSPADASNGLANDDATNDIVVTGVRASLTQALDVKRESVQIVELIVAEDVGKLPDNNAIEALQRVAGVQITDRSRGEARGISIRGLTDVTTTINGREVFTATGRTFNLQDIPANLVKRIDVFKTRAAEQLETGIAGQVNVLTRRPLDFDGFAISAVARGIYVEQRKKINLNVSGLISDRWETGIGDIGVLVNGSYWRNRNIEQNATSGAMVPFVAPDATVQTKQGANGGVWRPLDRIFNSDSRAPCRTTGPVGGAGLPAYLLACPSARPPAAGGVIPANPIWQAGLPEGLPRAAGSSLALENGDGSTYNLPYVLGRDAVFQNPLYTTRTRPAINAALQWAPNDNATYTAEFFWNQLKERNFSSLFFTFVDARPPAGVAPTDAVTLYPGTNIIKSRIVGNAAGFTSGDYTESQTDTYVYALTGEWKLTDTLHADANFNYQNSRFKSNFLAQRANITHPRADVVFNGGGNAPSLSFPGGADLTSPASWRLAEFFDNSNLNRSSAYTFQGNADYEPDNGGFIEKLSAGVRYDNRDGSESIRQQSTTGEPGGNIGQFGADSIFQQKGFFDNRADIPQNWVLTNGYWLADHRDEVRQRYNAYQPNRIALTENLTLTRNFDINEVNRAAYAQGDFQLDVFGRPLKIQAGVRFVNVKTKMSFAGTQDRAKVSRFLPAATLIYDLTDKFRLRANYGKTLRRPNFTSLNPTLILNDDVTLIGYGTGSSGNSQLKPTESDNYDLGAEWYFQRDSAIYATVFRRDIQGLVVNLQRSLQFDNSTIPSRYLNYRARNFIISQPVNASNGRLEGVEVGLTYFPKWLPAFASGLGFNGSLTLLDSKQDQPLTNSTGEQIGTLTNGIPGVSDFSYNATLVYERGPIGARLSYVWRKEFFQSNSATNFANPLAIFRVPEKSLDFQLTYNISDNAAVTLDATNITDADQASYYNQGPLSGQEITSAGRSIIGRSIALGLRFTLD